MQGRRREARGLRLEGEPLEIGGVPLRPTTKTTYRTPRTALSVAMH